MVWDNIASHLEGSAEATDLAESPWRRKQDAANQEDEERTKEATMKWALCQGVIWGPQCEDPQPRAALRAPP